MKVHTGANIPGNGHGIKLQLIERKGVVFLKGAMSPFQNGTRHLLYIDSCNLDACPLVCFAETVAVF